MNPTICSLGTFCHMASHLKRMNMRSCSYPFDWTLSSPAIVADCLRDDFQKFLDPAEHVSNGRGSSSHRTYGTQGFGNNFQGFVTQNSTFTHKDITQPNDYAYYTRCVERFRMLLKSSEPKCFILCTQDTDFVREDIQTLKTLLEERTTNFNIVCITLKNDYSSHYTVDKENDISYLTIYTYSRSDGRGYAMDSDNHFFHKVFTTLFPASPSS